MHPPSIRGSLPHVSPEPAYGLRRPSASLQQPCAGKPTRRLTLRGVELRTTKTIHSVNLAREPGSTGLAVGRSPTQLPRQSHYEV